jgi:hypothetical protein
MKWDEWRGSLDGRPTFWLKRLLYIPVWKRAGKWLGCRVDLHKFVGADDFDCFHSHPAYAIRIILWGGYVEEVHDEATYNPFGFCALKTWRPGMVGLVPPKMAHRVHSLRNKRVSYSLWLRGPIVAPVKLIGDGWPEDAPEVSPQGGKS